MIGSIRGSVLVVNPTSLLVEVSGVGYKIMVAPSVLSSMKVDDPIFLFIHDHIREDVHDLYGFLSSQDLSLFQQLLNVSGVGPKSAMTIMAVGTADTVRRAIMAGDLETLTSVPGVGKKTAQKIVLELKGQLVEISGLSEEDREVTQALQSLGYTAALAREAIKILPATTVGTSDRVREALKLLAKR